MFLRDLLYLNIARQWLEGEVLECLYCLSTCSHYVIYNIDD